MASDRDDYKKATFFREDEAVDLSERTSPSPADWFGGGGQKFKGLPALSDDMETEYDGWRQFFRRGSPGTADPIEYAHPLSNPLLPPGTLDDSSIKYKDEGSDMRSLIYVLEQAAEVFEAEGHIDLAAECERLCELALTEDK